MRIESGGMCVCVWVCLQGAEERALGFRIPKTYKYMYGGSRFICSFFYIFTTPSTHHLRLFTLYPWLIPLLSLAAFLSQYLMALHSVAIFCVFSRKYTVINKFLSFALSKSWTRCRYLVHSIWFHFCVCVRESMFHDNACIRVALECEWIGHIQSVIYSA